MIHFDPEYGGYAYIKGLWLWRRIYVGHRFVSLPDREQMAVILHEVGHCRLWHIERRLPRLLVFGRIACAAYLQRQELEADAYVASRGYGADLAKVLRCINGPDQTFRSERIALLEEAVKLGLANVKKAV